MPATLLAAGIPLSVDWCLGVWVVGIAAFVFLLATRAATKAKPPNNDDPEWRS